MFINPDIYNIRNLKENDKAEINAIEAVKQQVLNTDVLEDFIETKGIAGETTQGLYRDALNDFIDFLQERMEYCKVDRIMEKIDGYSAEDFNNICTNKIPNELQTHN